MTLCKPECRSSARLGANAGQQSVSTISGKNRVRKNFRVTTVSSYIISRSLKGFLNLATKLTYRFDIFSWGKFCKSQKRFLCSAMIASQNVILHSNTTEEERPPGFFLISRKPTPRPFLPICAFSRRTQSRRIGLREKIFDQLMEERPGRATVLPWSKLQKDNWSEKL